MPPIHLGACHFRATISAKRERNREASLSRFRAQLCSKLSHLHHFVVRIKFERFMVSATWLFRLPVKVFECVTHNLQNGFKYRIGWSRLLQYIRKANGFECCYVTPVTTEWQTTVAHFRTQHNFRLGSFWSHKPHCSATFINASSFESNWSHKIIGLDSFVT